MTHVIHYIMTSKWPSAGMIVDHIDRNPRNNAFANLREATPSQNSMNIDRSYLRTTWGLGEVLEQGTTKLANGSYRVMVCNIYIGIYKSRIAANEACRNARRELKGAFDVPFRTSRRMIRGSAV
jgi:hypothetical protein